jgi:exodeoxyribonuclease V alpha subunit
MKPKKQISFRVTSVRFNDKKFVIFAGVPIKGVKKRTATGIVVVKSNINNLAHNIEPVIGQHWTVTGQYTEDTVDFNGYKMKQRTFEAIGLDSIECTLPADGEEFIKFIANEKSFKGIGEVKSREIWSKFGVTVYDILSKITPDGYDALSEILTHKMIEALSKGFEKYSNLKASNWMFQRKIPSHVCQRLIKHHDDKSIDAIHNNPFILMTFGMSFKDVDKLAKGEFKVKDNDSNRLIAVIEKTLAERVAKGHTVVTQKELKVALSKKIGTNLAIEAMMLGYDKSSFIINKTTFTYHPTAMLIMEMVIAKRFMTLLNSDKAHNYNLQKSCEKAISEIPFQLTDEQVSTIGTSLSHNVACITGGAGTGKTTVLQAVINSYKYAGYQIEAVALSGRAAMRLRESIGSKTRTIAAFLRDAAINDLDSCKWLVVIDEASMIDTQMMYKIITHINPDVRILLVGDPNQLPAIGAGKVLLDIVNSKVIPNNTLNIVKRQKGSTGIPEYSNFIKQGVMPPFLSTENIIFHEVLPEAITSTCTDLYLQNPSDSQVLCATYKDEKGGIDSVNTLCQKTSNPSGRQMQFMHEQGLQFLNIRENDPVIFTQNNYDEDIQNGTLGRLISAESGGGFFGTVSLDDGREIMLTSVLIDCIKLAYAISLHKAQGSQFKRIIISLQSSRMIDRSWIYTAITRAETEIHIVGSSANFKRRVEAESTASVRYSYLQELLNNQGCF